MLQFHTEHSMKLLRNTKEKLNKHTLFLVTWLNNVRMSILLKFMYRFNESLWLPVSIIIFNDSHLWIFIPFWNSLPHHTRFGLIDQRNTIEVIVFYFRGLVIKHSAAYILITFSFLSPSLWRKKLPSLESTQAPL